MTPETIKLTKEIIAWAAQQGYYNVNKVAESFGNEIGEELYCDQPYYNSYDWKKKGEIIDIKDGEEPNSLEGWLDYYGLKESDIMTDDKGRYIMVEGESKWEKLYLPEWIQ